MPQYNTEEMLFNLLRIRLNGRKHATKEQLMNMCWPYKEDTIKEHIYNVIERLYQEEVLERKDE